MSKNKVSRVPVRADDITLHAMALNISNDDHLNKMPFSGILTRIDEPSDEAPHGTKGAKVTISRAAAEKALPTLLGMAVDYKPDLDGHDPKAKIGVITAANIDGDAIVIEGFIYKSDFPEVAEEIKAMKDSLGFSYEAKELWTPDPRANPVVISECTFTGAAILLKDKAAYHSTSIEASKDDDMSPELKEILDKLAEGQKATADKLAELSASVEKIKEEAKAPESVEANAAVREMVEPHAAKLDEVANGMECAGIGADPKAGHANELRKIAGHLRAAAALGKVPHVYHGYDLINAKADEEKTEEKVEDVKAAEEARAKEVADAIESATKPLNDKIAELETKLSDVKAQKFEASPQPERKTLAPAIAELLAKKGIDLPQAEGEKLAIDKLNAALENAAFNTDTRIKIKKALAAANLID